MRRMYEVGKAVHPAVTRTSQISVTYQNQYVSLSCHSQFGQAVVPGAVFQTITLGSGPLCVALPTWGSISLIQNLKRRA